MQGYFIKTIGQNRGRPRIWLENLEIASAGMRAGDRYDVHLKGGTVVLKANPDGSRVISHKENKRTGERNPIIDINSKELLALFDGMASIRLVQREGEIYLLPLASEIRKKERLNRLKSKMVSGEPLKVGSISHGGGLLSNAVHAGLEAAGIESRTAFANEIRPELLEHSSKQSGIWDKDTIPVAAPMQEFAFDDAAQRHIPKLDFLELGLPCSSASRAGRARRGTAKPEDHPEVGHLVVAALVILSKANPAVVLFENVVPYASSASASILRNQLMDMGYNTHETVLRGADFNALEHRDRWSMVAVTEGMHFDWNMLQMPKKKDLTLSEFLDDIADDDPSWSEMTGLKAKQERDLAAGKHFKMQTYDGTSPKVGTMTKGMVKNRSTDPKFEHPTNPQLLRVPTPAEHARIKQFPPGIIEGLSKTVAHEVLGQAVVRDPFVSAAKLVGESIKRFAFEQGIDDPALLVKAIAAEMTDTASMVVSEIRQPIAGVNYQGSVSVNELGMVIQDIGGGIGILHKHTALQDCKLGEELSVRYASTKAIPEVTYLSAMADAQSPLVKDILRKQQDQLAAQQSAPAPEEQTEFQHGLFDEPSPAPTLPRMG